MNTHRTSFRLRAVAAAAVTAFAGTWGGTASAVQLQVTQIPLLPGMTVGEGVAINSKGEVAGIALDSQGRLRSWYWSAATGAQEIGGPTVFGISTLVWGINESGTVVGNGTFAGGAHAFTWQAGSMKRLGKDGGALIDARGINNAGATVGEAPASGMPGSAGVLHPGAARAVILGSVDPARPTTAMAINDRGAVAGFGDTSNGKRAYIWTGEAGLRVLNSAVGSLYSEATAINERDDVLGQVMGPDGVLRAALWSGGTGMPTLIAGSGAYTAGFNLNDHGQVVGITGANADSTRGFLWSRRGGTVDIDSLLVPGSATGVLSVRDITNEGVMVGRGANGAAVMLTPTGSLSWQAVAGGSFSDASQWEHGFAPSRFIDATVAGPSSQTVVSDKDVTVKSLTVGGGSGRPTLALQNGARLTTESGSVLIAAGGTLTGDGRLSGTVVNKGTIQPVHLRIDGGLTNQGLITGSGRIDASIVNAGSIRVSANQTLVLAGSSPLTNTGRVEIRGGELETQGSLLNASGGRISLDGGVLRVSDGVTNRGSMEFGFGSSTVVGTVVTGSGGRVIVSGTGQALFNDGLEVQAGGELRVAAGSQALFYGMVRQRNGALMTGTGTKFYEGGLAVGNSPGTAIDEGSIGFGASNIYEAEIGAEGHDRLLVGGELQFGGTLKLIAWDGFAAQAGQRFDLFDWGTVTGKFVSIDASALALGAGLSLDASRLYADGSVAITAVPEPAPSSLLLLGLAALGLRRKRHFSHGG